MHQSANFNIEILYYFTRIAALKNYTQASKELYISQPTLSRHVKDLELRLGQKLFTRTKDGVELTLEGHHFYDECQKLLAAYNEFLVNVGTAKDKAAIRGSLTIMYQRQARLFLRQVNARFAQDYPDVTVNCMVLPSSSPVPALLTGAADCVYMNRAEYQRINHRNLYAFPVCTHQWVAVLPANHPWANRKSFHLADLQKKRFVQIERNVSPAIFDEFYAACNQSGFVPQVVSFCHDIENMINSVLVNNAVTIVSDSAYNFEGDSNIVARPIDDYPFPNVTYLVALPEKLNRVSNAYLSFVSFFIEGQQP